MSGFDKFLANKPLIASLKSDIEAHSLAHAYIIEGKSGSGKKTLARLICAAASCKEADRPCMECIDCEKILHGNSPDVSYIEADAGKVQLGVDVIRRLREDANFAPNDLERKFYIFPAADSMNIQAQNALLKLLEEPPPFVVFLLLAESADNLLPTIRSRAPTLRLELLTDELIAEKLPELSTDAARLKSSDPEAFAVAVRRASGSLGAALELCDGTRAKAALELQHTAERYIELLCERGRGELAFFEYASRLPAKQRGELADIYSQLRLAVRDLVAAKLAANSEPRVLFYSSADKARSVAERLPIAKLMRLYELFESARDGLDRNIGLPLSMNSTAMQALAIMSGRSIPTA